MPGRERGAHPTQGSEELFLVGREQLPLLHFLLVLLRGGRRRVNFFRPRVQPSTLSPLTVTLPTTHPANGMTSWTGRSTGRPPSLGVVWPPLRVPADRRQLNLHIARPKYLLRILRKEAEMRHEPHHIFRRLSGGQ